MDRQQILHLLLVSLTYAEDEEEVQALPQGGLEVLAKPEQA